MTEVQELSVGYKSLFGGRLETIAKPHVPGVRANGAFHSGSTSFFPQLSGASRAKLLQDGLWKGIFWPDGSTQKIPFHPSKRAMALPSPLSKYGSTCTHTHTQHTREGSIHHNYLRLSQWVITLWNIFHYCQNLPSRADCFEFEATIPACTISSCFQITWGVHAG